MATPGTPAEDFLKRPLYVYDLPAELLSTLTIKSDVQPTSVATTGTATPASSESSEKENGIPTAKTCALCQVSFQNVQEHRDHARSDHHRYNIKAQLRGNRPLTEIEFTKAIGEIDESISGSESSESDDEEDDPRSADSTLVALLKKQAKISQDAEDNEESRKQGSAGRQPLIWFSSPKLPSNTSVGVYRAVFTNEEQDERSHIVDSLRKKQLEPFKRVNNAAAAASNSGPHVFMCMIGGGHFAAMIVALAPEIQKKGGIEERQARVLAHKTFHRYTTRRKQGGSQSASDASRGAAHSAGSSLRRYNEAALEKDIRDLLRDWKSMIDTSQFIFVRATGNTNRRTLFGSYEGQVLKHNDPRLRNFPFSTRRATQAELMRCFKELTRVKVSQIDEAALAAAQPKQRETVSKSPKPPSQPKKPKLTEEEEAAMLHTSQIQALIRRSKAPALLSYIANNDIAPSFKFFPADALQNHHAPTPLHLAANSDSPALVTSLLEKAKFDPTVQNDEGKTPFDLARDRATRDAFRVARHELGESSWDWDAAHVPSPIARADVDRRQIQEREEAAKEEATRRKTEMDRLRAEEAASAAAAETKRNAGGRKLASLEKTAAEKREDEMRGMTPEMRTRLERERRARAAEERIRRLQGNEYTFDDLRVSARHLRIYTIVYDFENPLVIDPLVYAQDLSLNGTFWNGLPIDKQNGGAVLLSDGDILRLSPESYLEFRCELADKPLPPVQRKEANVGLWICLSGVADKNQDFASEYLITDRLLGEGSFGQVRMAVNMQSASQVACKVVDLRAVKKVVEKRLRRGEVKGTSLLELQKREVDILQKLCHPNIIRVEEVIRTENSLYIFEDLIAAGDLFAFVESMDGDIKDFDAASIMQQILIGLDYLHDSNIVHRDLKPENILMTSHGHGRRVVLADFGCAQIIPSEIKRMSSVVGTWDYTAPEVYKNSAAQGYTKSIDLWSVGCITVVLLMGAPPFPFTPSGQIECSEPGDMDEIFKQPRWNEVSALAQNLVLSLLVLDERRRLSAKEALGHCWFTNPEYKWRLDRDYQGAIRDWHPQIGIPFATPSHGAALGVRKMRKETVSPKNGSSIRRGFGSEGPSSVTCHAKQWSSANEEKLARFTPRGNDAYIIFQNSIPLKRSIGSQNWSEQTKEAGHLQTSTACSQAKSRSIDYSLRRPFSPHAWSVWKDGSTSYDTRKPTGCKKDQGMGSTKGAVLGVKQGEPSGLELLQEPNENSDASTTEPLLLRTTGAKGDLGSALASWSGESQEGGEVYEEVENKVTGKIQRVLYGKNRRLQSPRP
ncbi:Protein VMS1 [Talaromyces islandicus]|uniref:Protein VMS1 n=1 Tax=Talaromyces islandicus TaxID=28573 RepID=A0A0U1LUX2_TALIS|nr:Protein VMS1 [Talaromyces islandicus]